MKALGYMIFVFGLIVCLYGEARFLVVTRNRSSFWFFGCLFVPPLDLLFIVLNPRTTAKPLGLSLLGIVMAGLGNSMAGLEWPK